MKPEREFVIPFVGLKTGVHEFEHRLTPKFFEVFGNSEIEQGEFDVRIILDKQPLYMGVQLSINGAFDTLCDHCGDPMKLSVQTQAKLVVKFGAATSTDDDEVWVLGPQEHELPLAHFIYESVSLAIPLRHVHNTEQECNGESLSKINRYRVEEESSATWAALKNLNLPDTEEFSAEEEE